MRLDKFSNPIFEEEEVLDFIYENPDKIHDIQFSDILTESRITDTVGFARDVYDNDEANQVSFLVENRITPFDLADFSTNAYYNFKDMIMARCDTQEQATRVQTEFMEFERKGMQKMLLWLNYMVSTMRIHDVVWGVGRGSSVASYILYLIGVHKIDSLKYEIDHREFFK